MSGISQLYATNGDTSVAKPKGVSEVEIVNMPEGGGSSSVTDVTVDGTSVVNAQGVAAITMPSVPVQDVKVDGTSVLDENGVANIALPTALVPTVESTDNGKVLKAAYSEGQGSYSWENESGGGGGGDIVIVDFTGFSSLTDAEKINLWNSTVTAIEAGKNVIAKKDGSYTRKEYGHLAFYVPKGPIYEPRDGKIIFSSMAYHPGINTSEDVWVTYFNFKYGAYDSRPSLSQEAVLNPFITELDFKNNVNPSDTIYATDQGAITFYKLSSDPSTLKFSGIGTSFLYEKYVQWTCASNTTPPTVVDSSNNPLKANASNPATLTVGKTYQLHIVNDCYTITEFG